MKSTTYYATIEEASFAVIDMGIRSMEQYKHKHNEDPRLPQDPKAFYSEEWPAAGEDWFFATGECDYRKLIPVLQPVPVRLKPCHEHHDKRTLDDRSQVFQQIDTANEDQLREMLMDAVNVMSPGQLTNFRMNMDAQLEKNRSMNYRQMNLSPIFVN